MGSSTMKETVLKKMSISATAPSSDSEMPPSPWNSSAGRRRQRGGARAAAEISVQLGIAREQGGELAVDPHDEGGQLVDQQHDLLGELGDDERGEQARSCRRTAAR